MIALTVGICTILTLLPAEATTAWWSSLKESELARAFWLLDNDITRTFRQSAVGSQHSREVSFSSGGERDGESSLSLGVSEACMVGIIDNWLEKLKPNETLKLGEIYKASDSGEKHGIAGSGQLRGLRCPVADLCFSVSYLARFQSSQRVQRTMLRWLMTRLHRVQTMPSPEGSPSIGPRNVVGFCNASWNIARVRWSFDVSRMLHKGVFTKTRMSRAELRKHSCVQ